MAGAGVGLFSADLLRLNDGLHHLLDCLSAIVVHRLCRDERKAIQTVRPFSYLASET